VPKAQLAQLEDPAAEAYLPAVHVEQAVKPEAA